ncbi:MAG: response regulator transcription factor [Verrucomicrobiota bacterium]|nr:response regulator transcription factor [Verrucomicrobiota bacterium]
MKETTVLIADDHAIVRMGLAALLEPESGIRVIGEADDGDVAIRKTMRNKPDIVIMDIMMPVRDGISATQEIKSRLPHTRVLILTTSTVSDDLSRALEAGADGAITKSNANAQLLTAIRAIAAGKRWVSPEIEKQIATDPPVQKLTERQEQVLSSIVRGFTNADIAHQLGIREDSVKEHLNLIFSKIGAANRAEAVAIALRRHLLRF